MDPKHLCKTPDISRSLFDYRSPIPSIMEEKEESPPQIDTPPNQNLKTPPSKRSKEFVGYSNNSKSSISDWLLNSSQKKPCKNEPIDISALSKSMMTDVKKLKILSVFTIILEEKLKIHSLMIFKSTFENLKSLNQTLNMKKFGFLKLTSIFNRKQKELKKGFFTNFSEQFAKKFKNYMKGIMNVKKPGSFILSKPTPPPKLSILLSKMLKLTRDLINDHKAEDFKVSSKDLNLLIILQRGFNLLSFFYQYQRKKSLQTAFQTILKRTIQSIPEDDVTGIKDFSHYSIILHPAPDQKSNKPKTKLLKTPTKLNKSHMDNLLNISQSNSPIPVHMLSQQIIRVGEVSSHDLSSYYESSINISPEKRIEKFHNKLKNLSLILNKKLPSMKSKHLHKFLQYDQALFQVFRISENSRLREKLISFQKIETFASRKNVFMKILNNLMNLSKRFRSNLMLKSLLRWKDGGNKTDQSCFVKNEEILRKQQKRRDFLKELKRIALIFKNRMGISFEKIRDFVDLKKILKENKEIQVKDKIYGFVQLLKSLFLRKKCYGLRKIFTFSEGKVHKDINTKEQAKNLGINSLILTLRFSAHRRLSGVFKNLANASKETKIKAIEFHQKFAGLPIKIQKRNLINLTKALRFAHVFASSSQKTRKEHSMVLFANLIKSHQRLQKTEIFIVLRIIKKKTIKSLKTMVFVINSLAKARTNYIFQQFKRKSLKENPEKTKTFAEGLALLQKTLTTKEKLFVKDAFFTLIIHEHKEAFENQGKFLSFLRIFKKCYLLKIFWGFSAMKMHLNLGYLEFFISKRLFSQEKLEREKYVEVLIEKIEKQNLTEAQIINVLRGSFQNEEIDMKPEGENLNGDDQIFENNELGRREDRKRNAKALRNKPKITDVTPEHFDVEVDRAKNKPEKILRKKQNRNIEEEEPQSEGKIENCNENAKGEEKDFQNNEVEGRKEPKRNDKSLKNKPLVKNDEKDLKPKENNNFSHQIAEGQSTNKVGRENAAKKDEKTAPSKNENGFENKEVEGRKEPKRNDKSLRSKVIVENVQKNEEKPLNYEGEIPIDSKIKVEKNAPKNIKNEEDPKSEQESRDLEMGIGKDKCTQKNENKNTKKQIVNKPNNQVDDDVDKLEIQQAIDQTFDEKKQELCENPYEDKHWDLNRNVENSENIKKKPQKSNNNNERPEFENENIKINMNNEENPGKSKKKQQSLKMDQNTKAPEIVKSSKVNIPKLENTEKLNSQKSGKNENITENLKPNSNKEPNDLKNENEDLLNNNENDEKPKKNNRSLKKIVSINEQLPPQNPKKIPKNASQNLIDKTGNPSYREKPNSLPETQIKQKSPLDYEEFYDHSNENDGKENNNDGMGSENNNDGIGSDAKEQNENLNVVPIENKNQNLLQIPKKDHQALKNKPKDDISKELPLKATNQIKRNPSIEQISSNIGEEEEKEKFTNEYHPDKTNLKKEPIIEAGYKSNSLTFEEVTQGLPVTVKKAQSLIKYPEKYAEKKLLSKQIKEPVIENETYSSNQPLQYQEKPLVENKRKSKELEENPGKKFQEFEDGELRGGKPNNKGDKSLKSKYNNNGSKPEDENKDIINVPLSDKRLLRKENSMKKPDELISEIAGNLEQIDNEENDNQNQNEDPHFEDFELGGPKFNNRANKDLRSKLKTNIDHENDGVNYVVDNSDIPEKSNDFTQNQELTQTKLPGDFHDKSEKMFVKEPIIQTDLSCQNKLPGEFYDKSEKKLDKEAIRKTDPSYQNNDYGDIIQKCNDLLKQNVNNSEPHVEQNLSNDELQFGQNQKKTEKSSRNKQKPELINHQPEENFSKNPEKSMENIEQMVESLNPYDRNMQYSSNKPSTQQPPLKSNGLPDDFTIDQTKKPLLASEGSMKSSNKVELPSNRSIKGPKQNDLPRSANNADYFSKMEVPTSDMRIRTENTENADIEDEEPPYNRANEDEGPYARNYESENHEEYFERKPEFAKKSEVNQDNEELQEIMTQSLIPEDDNVNDDKRNHKETLSISSTNNKFETGRGDDTGIKAYFEVVCPGDMTNISRKYSDKSHMKSFEFVPTPQLKNNKSNEEIPSKLALNEEQFKNDFDEEQRKEIGKRKLINAENPNIEIAEGNELNTDNIDNNEDNIPNEDERKDRGKRKMKNQDKPQQDLTNPEITDEIFDKVNKFLALELEKQNKTMPLPDCNEAKDLNNHQNQLNEKNQFPIESFGFKILQNQPKQQNKLPTESHNFNNIPKNQQKEPNKVSSEYFAIENPQIQPQTTNQTKEQNRVFSPPVKTTSTETKFFMKSPIENKGKPFETIQEEEYFPSNRNSERDGSFPSVSLGIPDKNNNKLIENIPPKSISNSQRSPNNYQSAYENLFYTTNSQNSQTRFYKHNNYNKPIVPLDYQASKDLMNEGSFEEVDIPCRSLRPVNNYEEIEQIPLEKQPREDPLQNNLKNFQGKFKNDKSDLINKDRVKSTEKAKKPELHELFEDILEHRFESLKKQRQISIDITHKYKKDIEIREEMHEENCLNCEFCGKNYVQDDSFYRNILDTTELAIPQKTLNAEFLSNDEDEHPDRTLNVDFLE